MAALKTLVIACVATAALSTRAALGCDKLWNDVCFIFAAGDDVFWGSNCDFSGTDSGSARGGADKCGSLCRARGDACARWSWNDYQGGTCYFKRGGAPWTLVAAPGVQCGFRKFPQH